MGFKNKNKIEIIRAMTWRNIARIPAETSLNNVTTAHTTENDDVFACPEKIYRRLKML